MHSTPSTGGPEMQGNKSSRNIAARMGRWSAQHRKTAIFGWLAFIVVAFAAGTALGTKQLSQYDTGAGESGKASRLYAAAGFDRGDSESVIVQSDTASARSAAFRTVVADVVRRVSARPGVNEVKSPYGRGNAGQISKDGRSVLVQFQVADDVKIGGVLDTVAATQKAH